MKEKKKRRKKKEKKEEERKRGKDLKGWGEAWRECQKKLSQSSLYLLLDVFIS